MQEAHVEVDGKLIEGCSMRSHCGSSVIAQREEFIGARLYAGRVRMIRGM